MGRYQLPSSGGGLPLRRFPGCPEQRLWVGVQIFDDIDIPLLAHYEGGNTWFNVCLPLPYGASELYRILALAQNNVWAVGWQNPLGYGEDCSNQSLIYHFDGNSRTIFRIPRIPDSTWSALLRIPPTISMPPATAPTAIAMGSTRCSYSRTAISGTSFSPNPRNDPNFIADELLTGVAPSPGNVWIFGQRWFLPQGRCYEDCTLAIHEAP